MHACGVRLRTPGVPRRDLLFALVLLQLMVMPDVLLVKTIAPCAVAPGGHDCCIALPYLGSAFGIFLLRQTFLTIPQPLDDAARLEGCSLLARLWRVYVPLAQADLYRLWAGVGQLSLEQLPLASDHHQFSDHTATDRRLSVFATTDQGIDWSIVTAATLMTSAPLLVAFLLFQRQFVQSFMRAGIR